MRVLFFLEPVIFRNDPSFFQAHFVWVDYFRSAAHQSGGELALVANDDVCDAWRQQHGSRPGVGAYHALNAFEILGPFDYKRSKYARAVYDGTDGETVLTQRLREIRETFKPDLVVVTSQNALAKAAFVGLPVLHIEQAPLPRLGHPFRTMFDPGGHQVGSLLETHAEKIKGLAAKGKMRSDALKLLEAAKQNILKLEPRAAEAQAALRALRQDERVALLVTQPEDAVTYEGAYSHVEMENLLYAWAEALPPGWIGVPTYHAGQRMSEAMERALAQACPRLRFMPGDLGQGVTEALLLEADGMITISSTSAMTGLLFGKPVIATGRSPYNSWCPRDPAEIERAPTLTPAEIASTLCFLTHRYAQDHDSLYDNGAALTETVAAMLGSGDPADWFLDVSDWSLANAERLFRLDPPLTPEAQARRAAVQSDLQAQLNEAVAMRDVYENEWRAALADRETLLERLARNETHDQLGHDLGVQSGRAAHLEALVKPLEEQLAFMTKAEAEAAVARDVYKQEWSTALSHRETLQQELTTLTAQIAVLHDRCEIARARADALEVERIELFGHRTQLQTEKAELLSRYEHLQREAASAAEALGHARVRQGVLETLLAQYREWADVSREAIERSRGGRLTSSLRWAGLGIDLPSPPREAGANGSRD